MSVRAARPQAERVRTAEIRRGEVFVLKPGEPVARVHRVGGPHPMAWSDMRSWGPTPLGRFDHHTEPRRDHSTRSVAYASIGPRAIVTALAETFAVDTGIRPLDRHAHRRHLTIFSLRREVILLDLDSAWLTRAGGNRAVGSGARGTSRAWARAIYRYHPQVAGLVWGSSVYPPGRCVVLWDRAADDYPDRPLASRALSDPGLHEVLAAAADDLGVDLV